MTSPSWLWRCVTIALALIAPVIFLWAMFADRSRGSPPPPTRRPDARAALERHADAPDPDARAASIRLIRKRSRAC